MRRVTWVTGRLWASITWWMWEATVQGRTVGNIRGTGRNGIRRQPSLTWRPAYPGWRLRVRWPTRPGTHLPQITSSSTAGSWLFIQHGSYQWINSADQPHVQEGQVILYRGIHREETFRYPCLERDRQQRANQRTWNRYLCSGECCRIRRCRSIPSTTGPNVVKPQYTYGTLRR